MCIRSIDTMGFGVILQLFLQTFLFMAEAKGMDRCILDAALKLSRAFFSCYHVCQILPVDFVLFFIYFKT